MWKASGNRLSDLTKFIGVLHTLSSVSILPKQIRLLALYFFFGRSFLEWSLTENLASISTDVRHHVEMLNISHIRGDQTLKIRINLVFLNFSFSRP